MDHGGAECDPESMVRRGTAAGAGEDGGGASDRKTCAADPSEKIINYYVLILTVVLIIVRGLGVLAFAWSTVVLLGGFVQLIHRIDFWFITVISFAQTARIFDASADEQYLYLVDLLSRAVSTALSRIRNKQSATTSGADGFACSATKSPIKIFFTVLLVLIFPLFNIVVSSLRLRNKDFGNERNERPGVMIFYSLALSQGVLYLLWFILEKLKSLAVYKFDDKNLGLDRKYIEKYLKDTRSKCLKDLSATEGRNLIAYASGLLDSDHKDKYLAGAEILNHLISKDKLPNEELIRSSRKRIQKLVLMLSWRDKDYQDVRLLAAKIVLHVAGNISISQFPGTLESVSALIQPSESETYHVLFHSKFEQHIQEDVKRSTVESELIVKGLEILDKLDKDRNNALEILRADALLEDILAWICSKPFIRDREQVKWVDIVRLSFSVLARLASLGGQSAERLRRKIHFELYPSWVPHYAIYPKIQQLAIETYSHAFAMDKVGDESSGSPGSGKNEPDMKRKKFVEVVINLFLNREKGQARSTPVLPEVRKEAGEALTKLCVYPMNCHCLKLLDAASFLEVLLLSDELILYRALAADILKRFYAHRQATLTGFQSVLNKVLNLLVQLYPEMETSRSDGGVHGDNNNVTGISQTADQVSSSQQDNDEEHHARLEAALVRMLYDMHCNTTGNSFARMIEADRPAGFDFVVLLKRLIDKNSRIGTSAYHLEAVKRTGLLILSMIKSDREGIAMVKKIKHEKIMDSLSRASEDMSGADSRTLFVQNHQRGARAVESLAILVEKMKEKLNE
ncbi:unnamed protein product [Urochloa decumbens]|uniref:Uncharacterized protein n=1 Tax=Urochloa decumbens TaxID=240449 RepID=A0ABC9B3D8_9POAL